MPQSGLEIVTEYISGPFSLQVKTLTLCLVFLCLIFECFRLPEPDTHAYSCFSLSVSVILMSNSLCSSPIAIYDSLTAPWSPELCFVLCSSQTRLFSSMHPILLLCCGNLKWGGWSTKSLKERLTEAPNRRSSAWNEAKLKITCLVS